jgi:8-oxo-dGTP pyrophosphatase MutT (NUDIX family)
MLNHGKPEIELLGRRLADDNTRFSIYLDHIRASGGHEVKDYLVVDPKVRTASLVSGVAVLPCQEGRIGLLRLFRHPVGEEVWEMPRGFLETDEPPFVSALRELEEETGLLCPNDSLLDIGTILPEAGILRARVHLYAALDCVSVRPFPKEEIGHCEFRWFSRAEIDGLLRRSQIEDATTIAALYKLLLLGQLAEVK